MFNVPDEHGHAKLAASDTNQSRRRAGEESRDAGHYVTTHQIPLRNL
jgi:hypothetical protein